MQNQNFENLSNTYFSHANLENIVIQKGQVLFNQGDIVDHIYFLEDGELSIILNNQTIWQAFHNEFIGISSYFIGEPHYSSSVKACKESTLLKISFSDFETALKKYPVLNTSLMRLFNNRINLIFEKAKTHVSLTRKKRLVKLILDKAEKTNSGRNYVFNYSASDIAEFIGVSKNFAKKILEELSEKRFIRFNADHIEINDFSGLKHAYGMKIL